MTLAKQIVELLEQSPGLSDRQIADMLFGVGKPQQSVNIMCRNLEKHGILIRQNNHGNRIGNYLTGKEIAVSQNQTSNNKAVDEEYLSEDAIKEILESWLVAQGWNVKVAWGHVHGIDVEAIKDNSRWVIEAKGQGSLNPMRVNYFLGILGTSNGITQRCCHYPKNCSQDKPQNYINATFRCALLIRRKCPVYNLNHW